MPEPIKAGRRYMPGLDGLRAVAVLGVVAYHVGIDALPGGLLGVSVFFTLSGYLITDLLLGQIRSGEFGLGSFWLARVRRLVPALVVMLVVVAAWVTVIGPHQGPEFRTAAATAALYVNNWWLVFRDVSYFEQFDAPGPLNHLWSLAVEEQFYLLWPFLVLAGTRVIGELRPGSIRPRLGAVIVVLAATSTALMVVFFEPGTDPSRVYYGTDTRAAELLIGAALATIWPSQRLRGDVSRPARTTLEVAGVVGLGVVVVMFLRVGEFSSFLYRGGFLVLSIGVAAVVASVAHPASRLGPVLGCAPMRWIGERSYGIYLWHFPIIILTAPAGGVGDAGALRMVLQVSASVAVAGASWRYIENPIRHGVLGRAWDQLRDGTWQVRDRVRPVHGVAAAACTVVLVPALAGFGGARIDRDPGPGDGELAITETVTAEPDAATATPVTAAPSAVADGSGPCTSVVHVGGSTSLGLVSSSYIPDEDEQIPAQYSRVGVTTQHYEIAGGRAIIEGYRDNPPARESAAKWRDEGYRGCWVMALGTMDAANVAIGAPTTLAERIDIMMEIAGDDPVLWVNVKTIATTGSWRSEVMPPWNEALLDACGRYDNMRVYDWASDVQDSWFDVDRIHQDGPGYVERARLIADALATAFPGTTTEQTPTAGRGCSFDL